MNQLHINEMWRIQNLNVADTGFHRILVTFNLLPPDENIYSDALETIEVDADKLASAVRNDELYVVLIDGSRLTNEGNYVKVFGSVQSLAILQGKPDIFKSVYIGLGVTVAVIIVGLILYVFIKFKTMNHTNSNLEE